MPTGIEAGAEAWAGSTLFWRTTSGAEQGPVGLSAETGTALRLLRASRGAVGQSPTRTTLVTMARVAKRRAGSWYPRASRQSSPRRTPERPAG